MAAEFWEQGDLERTVLEQQPIVRTKWETGGGERERERRGGERERGERG